MSDKGSANCLSQICNGLAELPIHLLGTAHKYVLLASFTSDPLEKPYGKLRQGSKGKILLLTFWKNHMENLDKGQEELYSSTKS